MNDSFVKQTALWIKDFVIKHNLCPFAKQVMTKGQVRMVGSEASSEEELLEDFIKEILLLSEIDAKEVDTTIIVHPHVLQDFSKYLDFLAIAEYTLREMGMEGILQVASFHPDYQFEGTAFDDAGNFTNRSPYPTLHLLREESLTRVLAHYPNPEQIPVRNVAYLQALFSTSTNHAGSTDIF